MKDLKTLNNLFDDLIQQMEKNAGIPLKTCACGMRYFALLKRCPKCGRKNEDINE